MDRQTPSIDFAVIGHQDSWLNIQALINVMRTSELEELPISKIKGIYDYIPPRGIFKMHVKSLTGIETNGLYIDTFIAPDKLNAQNLRANIQKVKDAVKVVDHLNIKMAILGGFTSLLLEGNFKDFEDLKKRVKLLPDPIKIIVKRIISELRGEEKYNLFIGR